VQLSVLLPTHRSDLLACSRIAQACSWAKPNIEIIVRDNSGDAKKRAMLACFQRDNCNIIIADPCEPLENFSEIFRVAKGEFIFCIADDDFCFDRAIEAMPDIIKQVGKDSSVAGITGHYAVETSKGSSLFNYEGVDSNDVVARVTGYLKFSGPNVLAYSLQRREMVQRVFTFMRAMPFFFSFHDQIFSLLYLLNGKFVRLQRLLYLYDIGAWEVPESGQKRDVDFYKAAGLDPAINKLHWFLCGFEGAVLARNSNIFPNYSIAQRQVIADLWSSAMFNRFKGHARLTFGSSFADDAEKLCVKLKGITGPRSFDNMLTEISGVIALFSKDKSRSYYEFWDAVINRRIPSVDHSDVPAAIHEP